MFGRQPGLTEPVVIEALGQVWYFTPRVVRLLSYENSSTFDAMKSLILVHGSKKHFQIGEYQIESYGIPLRLSVDEDLIIVYDPYGD